MTLEEKHQVRVLSADILAATFPGTIAQWWYQQFAVLRSAGVLGKRGGKHFGTIAAVETWLTLSHKETTDSATV